MEEYSFRFLKHKRHIGPPTLSIEETADSPPLLPYIIIIKNIEFVGEVEPPPASPELLYSYN